MELIAAAYEKAGHVTRKRFVTTEHKIRLAKARDASSIAAMSRDLVEQGLGWRWTPQRIVRCIRDPAVNVAVTGDTGAPAGFAIMQYYDNEAHLLLLAVGDSHRRRGVGSALVEWLEATVLTAGIGAIFLDARAQNGGARAFYRKLGYAEIRVNRRFYRGREDGVRIAKDLWATHA